MNSDQVVLSPLNSSDITMQIHLAYDLTLSSNVSETDLGNG